MTATVGPHIGMCRPTATNIGPDGLCLLGYFNANCAHFIICVLCKQRKQVRSAQSLGWTYVVNNSTIYRVWSIRLLTRMVDVELYILQQILRSVWNCQQEAQTLTTWLLLMITFIFSASSIVSSSQRVNDNELLLLSPQAICMSKPSSASATKLGAPLYSGAPCWVACTGLCLVMQLVPYL